MNPLEKERLDALQALLPGGQIGCADLRLLNQPYPRGLSLLLPLNRSILQSGDEAAFYYHQAVELRTVIDSALYGCSRLLDEWGFQAIPIGCGQDERTLMGPISHKAVARLAGLGWIGKNTLLVSPTFGPGVRLATILTDALLPTGIPLSDGCGDCVACQDACPLGVIRGRTWLPNLRREDLFEPFLCNEFRMINSPEPGRKHSCGDCIRACPIGLV